MQHKLKPVENAARWKILDIQHLLWSFFSSHNSSSLPKNIKNILCIEFNYVGDLIAITPAIRALKMTFPKSLITLWTLQGYEDVLWGNPNLHKIITSYDNDDYKLLVVFHAGKVWSVHKTYKYVRNIPFKIGCTNHGMLSSYFPNLNKKLKYDSIQHIVEDNLAVVSLIGASHNNKSYELYYKKTNLSILRMHPSFNKSKPYIVLHPGSKNINQLKYPSHWWPVENWYALAKYFSRKFNIVINGTADEKFIYDKLNALNTENSFIDATGMFDINGLKNLIAEAKLLISIDSGPVHIASALNTPVISLMGPQNPVIWRPWTNRGVALSHAKSYCQRLSCKECYYKNMRAISVDEVITNAERLLK